MKKEMDFFGTPKRKPRVQCHVDGISIPGVGSMRLSNIPKNLWNMSNLLLTLGQKASSVLFYSFTLGVIDVKGDNCQEPGTSVNENLYLNYTQGDAFLWIKSYKNYDLIFPNNTCNFSVAEKQLGNYIFNGCVCSWGSEDWVAVYPVSLYGQNLTAELINCVEEQLQCPLSSFGKMMIAAICIGTFIVTGSFLFCCVRLMRKCDRVEFNRRNEEKSMSLNLSTLNNHPLPQPAPVFNPILNPPPTEPPSENNRWCCFRR